jgi:hypothetical protein
LTPTKRSCRSLIRAFLFGSGEMCPTRLDRHFLRDFDLENTRDSLIIIISSSSREHERGNAAQTGTAVGKAGGATATAAATHCSINAAALVRLVSECGGDGEWADRVAYLANGKLGKLRGRLGEMLLQQQVFPPVSGLFLCFGSYDDHDLYRGDQNVWSGFNCRWTRVDDKGRIAEIKEDSEFFCTTDSALCSTKRGPSSVVLGTMELKEWQTSTVDEGGMFKCVVLTSLTAIALVTRGAAAQVAAPFVVNVGQVAFLYVTTMRAGMRAPQVKFVLAAELSNREERVNLVATLAALLRRMRDVANDRKAGDLWLELALKEVESTRRSHGAPSSAHSAADGSSSGQSSKRAKLNSRANADGVPEGLTHLSRFDTQTYSHEDDSPQYFVGNYSRGGEAATTTSMPVFVKVWRQGDEGTSPRWIRSETELLRLTRREDVPCPKVIDELTAMSVVVDHKGPSMSMSTSTYHRLAMCRLADDPVQAQNLEAYALSLVRAVAKLHRAGILHCDLKPSNVVWDATTQTAFLVDFGHAQMEAGAKSYTGSHGYTGSPRGA